MPELHWIDVYAGIRQCRLYWKAELPDGRILKVFREREVDRVSIWLDGLEIGTAPSLEDGQAMALTLVKEHDADV